MRADQDHGLDHVGLNVIRLRLSGVLSSSAVSGHHLGLMTNNTKDTPVADHEDHEYDDVEGQEVPDKVDGLDRVAFPHRVRVAYAVHHGGRQHHQGHVVYERRDPRKCHCRVHHPVAQFVLAPDRMYDFQIALDGDAREVDHGTDDAGPDETFADDHRTEQEAGEAAEIHVADLHGVGDNDEQAAEQVESILIDDQGVLFVLF